MYVTSYRCLARWFLLGCLYSALAVSLKADIVTVDGTVYWAFNYDGCSPVNVTINYSCLWWDNANPYQNEYVGGHVWNTYSGGVEPGENILAPIGSAYDGSLCCQGDNQVVSAPDSLTEGYLPAQAMVNGTATCPQNVTWAASIPNPCAGTSTGPCDLVDQFALGGPQTNNVGSFGGQTFGNGFDITNNTGEPMSLPDGQVLQPGQGTDYQGTYSEGGTNGVTATTVGPGGQVQTDTGYFTYSNSMVSSGTPANDGSVSDDLVTNAGGPIVWTANTLSNTALTTAAGDSAIVNGQDQQDQLLSNLLSKPLAVNILSSNFMGGVGSNVCTAPCAPTICASHSAVSPQQPPPSIATSPACGRPGTLRSR